MTRTSTTTKRRSANRTHKQRKAPPASRAPMQFIAAADDDNVVSAQPPRILFKKQVLELVGHSFPTVWKWMRAGQFPLSFDVGSKTAWRADEIDHWLATRPRSQFKKSEPV